MGLSTSQLRSAWHEFECAKAKMDAFDFLGDTILVAPPTVEAWEALATVLRFHGYEVRGKDTDSYNCRAITGGTEKSLHSYGIALDINWQTNPYIDHKGSRKPKFSTKPTQDQRALDVKAAKADTDMTVVMIEDVLAIKTSKGKQVFEWGGNWETVKDSMHFEVDIGPQDIAEGIDWTTVKGERGVLEQPGPESSLGPTSAHEPTGAYTDAFLKCHLVVERWEGGYVNHPSDPGGPTNMGVTQAVLAEWRGHPATAMDVKNLTREEARRIFYAKYWIPLRADELALPVALMTYNCGVNSGIGRGGKFLQRVLNRQGAGLIEDGKIGRLSIQAAQTVNVQQAVSDYADIYEAFYRGLTTFNVFGRGWMNRLNEVSATANSLLPAPITASVDMQSSETVILQPEIMSGANVMSSMSNTNQMTAIDKVLGGNIMLGKKTLAAAATYAGAMLLQKSGVMQLAPENYDMVVQLIGLYGGLGLASKLERNGK